MSRKEYNKKYRAEHVEHISEYQKKYREENKEYIKELHSSYYIANKDKINESCVCECGKTYTRHNKVRHERSIRHQKFITNNIDL